MQNYGKWVSTRETPQSQPIPGCDMIKNAAGGFVFEADDWHRFNKFVVLGSAGGTYYTDAKDLTLQNADVVMRCLKENGPRVVAQLLEISESGRAPKVDPCLFALAMASSESCGADLETRKAAFEVLPRIARIPTHWMMYLEYVKAFRGRGRGLNSAIKRIYLEKDVDLLAYQMVKYRSRVGWTHRDILRTVRPKTSDAKRNSLFQWAVHPEDYEGGITIIDAFKSARVASVQELITLIERYGMTREMIPEAWLSSPEVWRALLQQMPLWAMTRNLGKMTSLGLFTSGWSETTSIVTDRLRDAALVKAARLHPWTVLMALLTYRSGHGQRGSLQWEPSVEIVDALDDCFYTAFENVVPSGKRIIVAVDQSGSMGFGGCTSPSQVPLLTAAAAMAMMTARTEYNYTILGFNMKAWHINVTKRDRLDEVIRKLTSGGGTDYTQPIQWAIDNDVKDVEAFVIFGDEETWAGNQHLCQIMKKYREISGLPTRLVVCGLCGNQGSVTDPEDSLSMNVVGLDAAAPRLIADFVRGDI